MPSQRLPPRCGQRLLRAKKSPERLNTTIARPFTSTSLRVPGGISSTLATTWPAILPPVGWVTRGLSAFHSPQIPGHANSPYGAVAPPTNLCKPVKRARVLAHDLAAALVVERRRQRQQRVV